MKKLIKCTAVLMSLVMLLSACGEKPADTSSAAPQPQEESLPVEEGNAVLYADFSCGNENGEELKLIKTKNVDLPEVTAEALAESLSNWTGLDFTLNSVTFVEDYVNIDWSKDSTLIANLDDRTQKDEFHFFDFDSLRWFMLDSLAKTVENNLAIDKIYFSCDGGKDIGFNMPLGDTTLPAHETYKYSPYYFSAELSGDNTSKSEFADTFGTWRLDGAKDTAYIVMDGSGSFTAYYASGTPECQGYLEVTERSGETYYDMYYPNGTVFNSFYINTDRLVMGDNLIDYIKE